jgi:hypothetical protein
MPAGRPEGREKRPAPVKARAEERARAKARRTEGSVAAFSRLELHAPADGQPSARPLAEVESRAGVRLRVFEATPELLRLLSAVCGLGGVR